ncbi:group 1 glycosyl transferase [Actinobacillus equuli]|nr:group 1 glycosyl transferase [Actinobacillus equuli]
MKVTLCYIKDALDDYIKRDVIEYLGYVDNVPEVIANSSVFVLPSYREGVPRSIKKQWQSVEPSLQQMYRDAVKRLSIRKTAY